MNATAGTLPRICMPTGRRLGQEVFRCSLYEAEDILTEVDDVDLIELGKSSARRLSDRWLQRLIFRDVSDRLVFTNPGLHPIRLGRDYDVFVAVCQTYEDLLNINAVENWKARCATSICWIDEIWAGSIPKYRHWLAALRKFDHVFVGYEGTVKPLSDALGRTCHWMPGAVDTIRFSPRGDARTIDVYGIGRRWEGVHQALRQMAGTGEIFYLHDTFRVAGAAVLDYREHREVFADIARRSRYFLVAPAKMDVPNETKGQIEVGYRYYEGAAAGAVMVGRAPESAAFRRMFDWPDAVIEIAIDGSDVAGLLRDLNGQPDRLAQIARRNAAGALRRHDWVHRWAQIFEIAGIRPSSGMLARQERLEKMARAIGGATVLRLRAL